MLHNDPEFLARGSLFGAYTIRTPLGAGGQARVYLAYHRDLRREVALKLYPVVKPGSKAFQRFEREFRILTSVRHDHVITVLDAGVHGDVPYLSMDVVRGESFADIIAQDSPLDPGRFLELALPVAEGLAHLHAAAILHRDIKPSNLVCDPTEQTAKIVDFGVASAPRVTTITEEGAIVGTIRYLAPELLAGAEPSAASDVYCLGLVYYELLSREFPHASGNECALLELIQSADPRPLASLAPGLDRKLCELVMRMIARDVGDRPEMHQVVDFLESFAVSHPGPKSRPDGSRMRPTGPPDRPGSGGPLRHLAVGTLLVCLALGCWGLLGHRSQTGGRVQVSFVEASGDLTWVTTGGKATEIQLEPPGGTDGTVKVVDSGGVLAARTRLPGAGESLALSWARGAERIGACPMPRLPFPLFPSHARVLEIGAQGGEDFTWNLHILESGDERIVRGEWTGTGVRFFPSPHAVHGPLSLIRLEGIRDESHDGAVTVTIEIRRSIPDPRQTELEVSRLLELARERALDPGKELRRLLEWPESQAPVDSGSLTHPGEEDDFAWLQALTPLALTARIVRSELPFDPVARVFGSDRLRMTVGLPVEHFPLEDLRALLEGFDIEKSSFLEKMAINSFADILADGADPRQVRVRDHMNTMRFWAGKHTLPIRAPRQALRGGHGILRLHMSPLHPRNLVRLRLAGNPGRFSTIIPSPAVLGPPAELRKKLETNSYWAHIDQITREGSLVDVRVPLSSLGSGLPPEAELEIQGLPGMEKMQSGLLVFGLEWVEDAAP